MGKRFLFLLAMVALALPIAAHAQCTGGLIANCPSAVNPQPNDLALSWQVNQTPHTRAQTDAQILTGALGATVVGKINAQVSTSAGAGFNVGVGLSPVTCTSGDVWQTSAGLFSCVNNSAQGPYSTSGNFQGVFPTAVSLPPVVAGNNGQTAFVQNCPNGAQSGGSATGCLYLVDVTGTWTAQPNPFSSPITVGGQALYPGASTANQGNGSLIQLASGAKGNVGNALVFDANGNAVDGGVPPSGGSGGTTNNAAQNSIPFYSTSGSSNVLSGLTQVNNSVLSRNGSGTVAEVSTLPSGLTIPSATLSSPTLSGTISISAATYTGKQTYAAGVTGAASVNIPPGVAPTSPVNGDEWSTTAGKFVRANGATQGPLIASLVGSGGVTIAGGGTASLTAACATCALLPTGGTLTATAPITISSTGLIALGGQPRAFEYFADSTTTVHNDTYVLDPSWTPTNSGTIKSISYLTGGTSTPSFVASIQINGVPVTGCSSISVSSSTVATTTCTAAQTITTGQALTLVITSTSGAPASAVVKVNTTFPAS